MTVLSYVNNNGFELRVCGTPSKAWVEWVRTATVPLTPHQQWWRERALERHPTETEEHHDDH